MIPRLLGGARCRRFSLRARGRRWPAPLVAVVALVCATAVLAGCNSANSQTTATSSLTQTVTAAERQTAGAPSPKNPSEFISLCANCHDRLDTPLSWRQQRKLVFNHEAHFAKGIRCVACHQQFPHKPGKTIHVAVETCFECHGLTHGQEGILAPTSCDTCHTRDIATITPDHKRADWLLVSGSQKALHSVEGKQRPLYCRMCHQESFCAGCHKVEMPHPIDWTKTGHQPVAKADRISCARCHPDKNFCNDCHHKALPKLADWGRQHKSVAISMGPSACYTCHKPLFCAACHVTVGKQRGTLGK